ncbi:MAG: DEAD/DEAH box helicase family protein [Methanobacteriaceae archaeon]
MGLKNVTVKISYDSDTDHMIDDFYIPMLSNSTKYYRLSGFFSSSTLASAARGMEEFIKNGGKMQLVCSAKLSGEDVKIISEAHESPESIIIKSMIKDLDDIGDEFIKNHVEALGWMVANNKLEIKIAILKDSNGKLIPDTKVKTMGMFHQKVGIFEDEYGNLVSFSGSDNETFSGWQENIEEFKVFKGWGTTEEYAFEDYKRFKKYWANKGNKIETIPIPNAIKQKLIDESPTNIPKLRRNSKGDTRKGKNILLRDYQKEAINAWKSNGSSGIFEMATGTGKTYTALACFKELLYSEKKLLTVIACPQSHLIDQWVVDVKQFFDGDIVIASSKNHKWKPDLKKLMRDFLMGTKNKAVVMTTHITLSSDYFKKCIWKNNARKLLIVDEVHGIGSYKQQGGLMNTYDYRLGLSATPSRWFDEEGTGIIIKYFKDIVFDFDIQKALEAGFLTHYEYNPIIVDLNNEEMEDYEKYSLKIAAMYDNPKFEKELTALCVLRQNIINNASEKLYAFKKILKENPDIKNLIVYASPQQITEVQKILNENRVTQHKFTQKENATKSKNYGGLSQREYLIKNFKEGNYKALVAIKCLDEGVDVPSAENAIIMSSTSNPREHIQRRGRILRKSKGKDKATIYDIVVFPKDKTPIGNKIIQKEIRRYREFAKTALNSYECLKLIKKYYQ